MVDGSTAKKEGSGQDVCPVLSLDVAASQLRLGDGRALPFERAVLALRNVCAAELTEIVPHATLGQEGGTVQDVSGVLAGAAVLPAGGSISWDVYDHLIPAHAGSASKVHMFGHRAVLNWTFEITAWADYRAAGVERVRTPESRWTLRWSIPDPTTGGVVLKIDKKAG